MILYQLHLNITISYWYSNWFWLLFVLLSYGVTGAKHQLLQNLRRFEKLAELDPIELEKRMLEEQDENYDLDEEEREETE